jgi:hypothetical protein
VLDYLQSEEDNLLRDKLMLCRLHSNSQNGGGGGSSAKKQKKHEQTILTECNFWLFFIKKFMSSFVFLKVL